jgi:hypothetical protein
VFHVFHDLLVVFFVMIVPASPATVLRLGSWQSSILDDVIIASEGLTWHLLKARNWFWQAAAYKAFHVFFHGV